MYHKLYHKNKRFVPQVERETTSRLTNKQQKDRIEGKGRENLVKSDKKSKEKGLYHNLYHNLYHKFKGAWLKDLICTTNEKVHE